MHTSHPDHKPQWFTRPLTTDGRLGEVAAVLRETGLITVCAEARCPNRIECFSAGTATFLILGDVCTRNCRFCAVKSGAPGPADHSEPSRLALAAEKLKLTHVVVTSVTRDDLPDGGAGHFAAVIRAVRGRCPDAGVEVLTPDFQGRTVPLETVLDAGPDVFAHNIETVPRLYVKARPGASYERSLDLLSRASAFDPTCPVKSGIMLGMGETDDEIETVLTDMRDAGVWFLTLGQYLAPGTDFLPVARWVHPDEFARWETRARELGFTAVASGPLVRSSYKAGDMVTRSREYFRKV